MALASVQEVNHGEVFTKPWVARLILDLVGYRASEDLSDSVIIEPACGNGVFVAEIVTRFLDSCEAANVDPKDRPEAIYATDLNGSSIKETRRIVREILRERGLDGAAKLARSWVRESDFLLADLPSADFVVGNPPYVRLEEINPALVEQYRSACPTMGGRADLYVGFFERSLLTLRKGGKLGFICADRWMRNSYGKGLRSLIAEGPFSVELNISLHDVDCFERPVSAYPAITVIEAADVQGQGAVVQTETQFGPSDCEGLVSFAAGTEQQASGGSWSAARLDGWHQSPMWPEGTPDELLLLRDLESRFEPLEDLLRLTRAGIGVATGADDVYVTSNPELVEPDRLLPLAMHAHIAKGELDWTDRRYLVNPWGEAGLVDLDDYPKLTRYLESHSRLVSRRHVAQKNPRNWYRTIDRVNGWLTDQPKILLADMKDRITPVVEPGGLYPHHNLYWITSEIWPIRTLAGLLMTDFANLFVKSYCVKMRGGTLRFQTQYLRQIRLPDPSKLEEDLMEALAVAYDVGDISQANEAAEFAYQQSLPKLCEGI